MKKVICVLIILLMCSGCNDIKYSIKFGETITEEVVVFDENHKEEDLNLEDGYMDDMSAFEFFFQTLPYRSNSNGKGTYSATKDFNNTIDFVEQSFVFTKLLSSDSIKVNNKKVNINISNDHILKSINVDNLEISLYIPYYVSKHNADKVSNDTYTWIIDDIEKDSIKINFDMSKGTNYKNKIWSVVAVLVFAIIVVLVTIYFVKRNKEANEI